jgi:DNA-binding NtrC family response regulator
VAAVSTPAPIVAHPSAVTRLPVHTERTQDASALLNATGPISLKDIARTAAREAERELILRMLTRTRWNRKEAAEILGISYKALLYKIKENGLDKAS